MATGVAAMSQLTKESPMLFMNHLRVRHYAAATVFYILSALLFPVTLLGYLIWAGKGLLTCV